MEMNVIDLFVLVVLNLADLSQVALACSSGSTCHLDYSCTSCSPNATCIINRSCSKDYSKDSQLLECSKLSRSKGISASPTVSSTNTIYGCPYNKHCVGRKELNSTFIKVQSLKWREKPVNASHFALDVQWDWNPHDLGYIHVIDGYELRVKKNNTLIKCLCIREPSLFNISLGVEDAFGYDSTANRNLSLSLATFPFGFWAPGEYTKENSSRWPLECSGSDACLPQLPLAPLSSVSYSTEELTVSWTETSPNDLYYVKLDSISHNETVNIFVNGSTCISVGGLPSAGSWSVRVQGYSPCAGLSSYFSNKNNPIGCGRWSAFSQPLEMTSSTFSTSFLGNPKYNRDSSLIASLVVGVFSVAVLATTGIIIIMYLWRISNKRKSTAIFAELDGPGVVSPYHNKPAKVEALVLYSLGTPTHEKIEIETYIVGFLKRQDLNVISCNDHTEKTIVQWVEENARLAHAVFIICNKQFGLDWKMNSRTQLINSLEMIVASAVGQNRFKKFATILLRPEDDEYVPDNLYFKGIKSFVLGSRASCDEKENLLNFIKCNSATPC